MTQAVSVRGVMETGDEEIALLHNAIVYLLGFA
jgi:hypothetical protein